ncbi:MAG: cupredoxin domain-containing protein [Thermoplasmata archaeon]
MGVGSPNSPAPPLPRPGRIFVPVIFAVGFILVGVVAVLGLGGHLQTTIPGNEKAAPTPTVPVTACQGRGASGSFHFLIVAGTNGGLTFNGTSPGPCFAVATGSAVSVTFEVSDRTNQFSGWVLINGTGSTNQEPAFPNAGESGAARFSGIAPGYIVTFNFTAGSPGEYRYVSEVSNDAAVGMWGGFNVTDGPITTTMHGLPAPSGSAPSPLSYGFAARMDL